MNKYAGTQKECYWDVQVSRICGSQWRMLDEYSRNAAWGIAIIKAVLDGARPDINDLSYYLGVDRDTISTPLRNLILNGVFDSDKLTKDAKDLRAGDELAWGYYGGYACGATGPFRP